MRKFAVIVAALLLGFVSVSAQTQAVPDVAAAQEQAVVAAEQAEPQAVAQETAQAVEPEQAESQTVVAEQTAPEKSAEGGFDMMSYLFGHVLDSYEWHITTIGDKNISIPLPCILISKEKGVDVFLFSKLEEAEHEGKTYKGYYIPEEGPNKGKIVFDSATASTAGTSTSANDSTASTAGTSTSANDSTVDAVAEDGAAIQIRPFDISITKNVLSLFMASALLLWLILACSRWYRRHDVLKEAPTGVANLLEPVINMIDQDVIKASIGEGYERFSPYLLTAFFFILLNNLMGIVPFFPGGANLTGNIAVTMVLALCTFIAINAFGTKEYFKEIFWPDVPVFLKAIPIMPVIEIIGMFTKPFSLMIRLFANILAGHILILSVIAVIFITATMGPVLNGSLSFVSVLFGVFMDFLELLVAFIQAYVFTMLSSVFIGLAHPKEEHKAEEKN